MEKNDQYIIILRSSPLPMHHRQEGGVGAKKKHLDKQDRQFKKKKRNTTQGMNQFNKSLKLTKKQYYITHKTKSAR